MRTPQLTTLSPFPPFSMETIAPWLVTMKGRYIHSVDKKLTFQPYGVGPTQTNYSVSRADLNKLLLTQCEALPGSPITLSFNEKFVKMAADGTVTTRKGAGRASKRLVTRYRFVIGADGVFSGVRSSLMRLTHMDFTQTHISACYKELTIPDDEKGGFALKPSDGLHIWSRHNFMLIALPNPDKTFTGTLFAPLEGENGLNSLTDKAKVLDFFNRHFPDAVCHIGSRHAGAVYAAPDLTPIPAPLCLCRFL
jgi:kynurenine 3-monooxygenase